jgi:hypothetical protein
MRSDPQRTSGMIMVGRVTTAKSNAATSSPDDESEQDKTRDEPCHHPEQEPLVRFHRFSETGRDARLPVVFLRSVLLAAMASRDLAIVRQ